AVRGSAPGPPPDRPDPPLPEATLAPMPLRGEGTRVRLRRAGRSESTDVLHPHGPPLAKFLHPMPTKHPLSTYRVQLRPEFGFDAAAAIAGYLANLGISHLYSSPYLQAARGSAHGYDVVDPTRV